LAALLAATALAASAAPAFSDGSGAVALSVTAQPPPVPCLTLSASTRDFGVLPFATPGSTGSFGGTLWTMTNCGTAGENVLASATNASGPSGSWTLTSPFAYNPCPTINAFSLLWHIADQNGIPLQSFLNMSLSNTPQMATNNHNPADPWVFSAGGLTYSSLDLAMPCRGSNGAGETKTFTATFTAVVA
jgi:hypothetical protein